MPLIDTHCHIDFPAYDHDREEVIGRCKLLSVDKLIVPGVYATGIGDLLRLCHRIPNLYPALGLHPCYVEQMSESDLDYLDESIAKNSKIVAVGEIGLDYYIQNAREEKQAVFFERQVKIACQQGLPLMLHVRKAHDQVASVLKKRKFDCGGVIHCYSGSLQQAKRYLGLGFKLGIGGVITYTRATRLRHIVQELPLNSFVLETDAPDIPVFGREKERNSPEYLPEILSAFAELRPEAEDVVENQLYQNTVELFQRLKN